MPTPIQILISGARGRMGQAVREACEADPEAAVGAEIDLGDSLAEVLPACDAVIDFSVHSTTVELAQACAGDGKKLVIGTTGHTDEELAAISEVSKSLPIVFAPNYSVGVNTLFWLTKKAAETLGPEFDLEVIEMHHRHKVDAPSGTARRLA